MTDRVAVFGATGFIGSRILLALDDAPSITTVLAAGRSPRGGGDGVDLATRTVDELRALLHRAAPSVIVNASGRTSGTDAELEIANVVTVDRLLAAVDGLEMRPQLVQIGSAAEYGPSPYGVLTTEDHEPAPTSAYGRTKLAATERVIAAGDEAGDEAGAGAVVLRVFNAIGWGTPESTLPGGVARRLVEAVQLGSPTIETGPLDAVRDFVDVDDVAAAVVRAVDHDGRRTEIVNIGRGEPISVRELVGALVDRSGFVGDVDERRAGSARSPAVSWQVADPAKAGQLLGWEPRRSLADSITSLWQSMRPAEVGGP